MIDQKRFHQYLQNEGVMFITGIPDSLLNDFCSYVSAEMPPDRHVIAANEGNAVALAAGYHLATGSVPLVYMQNSGLGNAINPLLSLVDKGVYAIPLVLLIGWRGESGVKDHVQHRKQGELTPVFLDAMNIPFKIIEGDGQNAFEAATWAVRLAREISCPTALLAKKGAFSALKKETDSPCECQNKMNRENAIECIVGSAPKNTIFVATTGRATRELYKLRELSGDRHDMDFLNVGAMGHTSSIAAGIALAQKKLPVICLDGDGAAIMHLGGLTTIGKLGQANLLHVVLNNGAHESVGGQPTAGFKANLTAIAKNSGYKTVGVAVETKYALRKAIEELLANEGPGFIDVRIRKEASDSLSPLRVSHVSLKNMFMKSISE